MRVPMSWLNEYCDTGLEPAVLAEKMAMTGTEVKGWRSPDPRRPRT